MFFTKSIILALAACAVAHPGHEAKEALAGREVYHNNKRALDACATKLEALQTRGVERRKAEMERQRAARGIPINSRCTPARPPRCRRPGRSSPLPPR